MRTEFSGHPPHTIRKFHNALAFKRSAGRASEIAAMEKELSAAKKAAKNIVAAIEQGIITTTRERLLAQEDEAAMPERSPAVARAAHQSTYKSSLDRQIKAAFMLCAFNQTRLDCTSFSYCSICGNHAPSAGLPQALQ